MKDENDFDLQLYNITDDKIRGNASEKIPTDQKVKVSISQQALLAYEKNARGSKSGNFDIKALACPVLFSDNAYLGAFLYQDIEANRTL